MADPTAIAAPIAAAGANVTGDGVPLAGVGAFPDGGDAELWPAASQPPRPPATELHIWWLELDAPATAAEPQERGAHLPALSVDERERAEQVLGLCERRRWEAGRAGLRAVLALYLGCEPGEVALGAGPAGKPQLQAGREELHFNVSHSGAHALYAVAGQEVGVDLELARPRPRMEAIARRFSTDAELERIRRLPLPQRERELLRCWVRREAAVKCLGTGLASWAAPGQVGRREAAAGRGPGAGVDRRLAGVWTSDLRAPPGTDAIAAVASRGEPSAVRCLRLAAPAPAARAGRSASGSR